MQHLAILFSGPPKPEAFSGAVEAGDYVRTSQPQLEPALPCLKPKSSILATIGILNVMG